MIARRPDATLEISNTGGFGEQQWHHVRTKLHNAASRVFLAHTSSGDGERRVLTISGLEVEFALSTWPKLSTLQVSLFADDTHDSKIRDLVIDVDFTYVADGNSLRFEREQVPPAEQWIVAEYENAPSSAGGAL